MITDEIDEEWEEWEEWEECEEWICTKSSLLLDSFFISFANSQDAKLMSL